ncbi:hypothetical protein [uncultured Methanobrevibacter sp.]|uniref:hypothetical protein n=1 Tax=uncultured Methanobrevibacter sp. TaxID=253161 RepID=UPI0025CE8322|nr:hypothetical protein [uncultured Methanobrevibacter sp.]
MDDYISTDNFTDNLKQLENKIVKTNYDKQLLRQKKVMQNRKYKNNSTNKDMVTIME